MSVCLRHCMVSIVVVAAVGCSTEGDSSAADFYDTPETLPSDVPGTLIRAEPMEPFTEGSRAWRVLYVSTAVNGAPIAVSGMVASPSGPAPDGGRDVVSWAHGLTGISDRCAPSRAFRFFGHDFYDLAPEIIAAGYVGVATDYEGLGTAGVHPFLVGPSEGRGLLDIVRAAQQIEEAGAGDRVVVWGLSQGGHGALFAGELAASWAPELELLGIVSVAPASELQTVVMSGQLFPRLRFFFWLLGLGFEAAYGDLAVADIFSPDAIDAMDRLLEQEACYEEAEAAGMEFEGPMFATDPLDMGGWSDRLLENSPGYVRTEAPILMLQSEDDPATPVLLTNALVDRLCAIGSEPDYRVFEGLGHDETSMANVPLMVEWTQARFAGEATTSTCE